MTNYEMVEEPNGVVLLGLRAWLSLAGIMLILVGSWRFDRRWDDGDDDNDYGAGGDAQDIEKTKTATKTNTQKTTSNAKQQQQQEQPPSWTNVSNMVNEYAESAYRTITEGANPGSDPRQPEEDNGGVDSSKSVDNLIQSASTLLFTSPYGKDLGLALAGWAILMLSCFIRVDYRWGLHAGGRALVIVLMLAVIATIQSVILPTAMTGRWVHPHHDMIAAGWSTAYLLLALLLAVGHAAVPLWLPLAGVFAIVSGFYIFWFHRKRGDSYDRTGVPNTGAVVFHAGGPLILAGWLMMWVSFNLLEIQPGMMWGVGAFHLPLYWTSRTAMACEGAFAIIAAYWLINHAHDEHFDGDNHIINMSRNRFTSVTDIRLSFVVSYAILGITSYLPAVGQKWFYPTLIFLTIVTTGFAAGVQQVLGLRAGDADKLHRWSRVTLILMTILSVLVLICHGWRAGILVYLGTITMSMGFGRLHHDRKRGAFWLQTDTANPHVDVYSFGVLVFPLGVLLLAWGMSLP